MSTERTTTNVSKPQDYSFIDPSGNYAAGLKTNQDAFTRYAAMMAEQGNNIANMSGATAQAGQFNYNPVSYRDPGAYQAPAAYNPGAGYQPNQYNPQAAFSGPGAYDPNAAYSRFLSQSGDLQNLAQGATSPLTAQLNAIAQQQAAAGGEAALAAMGPGLRNSGAAMAAFGKAYAEPFAQVAAQQQQNQLGLTGQLWNQAQQQAVSEGQFGYGQAADLSKYGYGQSLADQQFAAQYGANQQQFGYGADLQAQQFAADQAMKNAQFGYGASQQNAQYAADLASKENQYGAGLAVNQNQFNAGMQNDAYSRQLQAYAALLSQYGGLANQGLSGYSALAGNQGQWITPTYVTNPSQMDYWMQGIGAGAQAAGAVAGFLPTKKV